MRIRFPWGLLLLVAVSASACGRDGLSVLPPDAGAGAGAEAGTRGIPGIGTIVRMLPDGGLATLLGEGALADLLCGPKVKSGQACSFDAPACVLSDLGGVCVCTSGRTMCPGDTTSGPKPCPVGVATGTTCSSPLSICIAQTTACLCGMGTYSCL